ncbi:MAG: glycosyltransferase [Bacteroidetes bacterium]|nr:MAG: glycosyltransferase [Bacteroidota bacterium]
MKILFLYTELAAYFHACVQQLVRHYEAEALIFMWPVNAAAPFQFVSEQHIHIHEKTEYDRPALLRACQAFGPDVVYVSGWGDADYNELARHFRRQGKPVICGMDNQWKGSLRQRLACLAAPWMLKRRFSHIWVAGLYQYEYARRLGYGPENILTGLYCAHLAPFRAVYQQSLPHKQQQYPRNFLYVGRLAPEKDSMTLYRLFQQLHKQRQGWKLIMAGTGPEQDQMPGLPGIEMRGFVQPEALPALAAEAGCLVLPSLHEPWGVVVQEFAAAGLPMLVSGAVGARAAFVVEGYNGYVVRPGDPQDLKEGMQRIMQQPDEALLQMGRRSAQLSLQLTPASWAATLLSVLPRREVKIRQLGETMSSH